MGFISIIVENFKRKKPKKCEKNIFIIYSPKNEIIDEADTCTIDTEISIKLPKNTDSYLATKCEGQEIIKIIGWTNSKKRLWITLLSESYLNKYRIFKRGRLGYLVIEPNNHPIRLDAAAKQKKEKKRK